MRKLRIGLAAVACVFTIAGSVMAHHAANTYDREKSITLEGTVTEWRLGNPHPVLYFTVKKPDGTVEEWFAESQSPLYRWFNNGWNKNTVKPGDTITITGHPSKEPGRTRIAIEKVVAPNGQEYPPKGGRIEPLE
jgi:hypothetical protein